MNRVSVLDKGFVRLVDHMGSDLTVVNAARVSFAKESSWDLRVYEPEHEGDTGYVVEVLKDKDAKLIRYLAEHKHWTPFAHLQITLHVKAPIFVARQLYKHKVGLVENEVSRRYVDDEPEFYEPAVWRGRPVGGAKQGSSGELDRHTSAWVGQEIKANNEHALRAYEFALAQGVAPEMARMVLPQSMYTEWWWTGSLAAFARIYHQRTDPHAQWETQEYARAIGQLVAPLFPVSWEALTNGA